MAFIWRITGIGVAFTGAWDCLVSVACVGRLHTISSIVLDIPRMSRIGGGK